MTDNRNDAPQERAPLLLVFGDLAGRVAALVRARPNLTGRLIVAPRAAVHAIGAYLHLVPEATKSGAELAQIIDDTDPRDLLSAALPGCPPRLFRALDRAGDHVRNRVFYERLGAISRGPFSSALLDGGDLGDGRLGFFEELLKMDPVVAPPHGMLAEARYHADGVNSLIIFLRAHGVLHDGEFRLPSKAGLPALGRRLQRALGRIPAPDPGFSPPPAYRVVTSTVELQRIGKAFGNCVALPNYHAAEHHFRLLNGTGVFLVSEEPPLLVALRPVGGGLWVLDQMAGPKNAAPPKGALAALIRDLAVAGVQVISIDPQSALSRLDAESRGRREPDHDDNDVDDDMDDDIEEEAA